MVMLIVMLLSSEFIYLQYFYEILKIHIFSVIQWHNCLILKLNLHCIIKVKRYRVGQETNLY